MLMVRRNEPYMQRFWYDMMMRLCAREWERGNQDELVGLMAEYLE